MSTDIPLTRRGFVVGVGVAASAVLLAPPRVFAQPTPPEEEGIVARMRRAGAEATIAVQTLRDGISVLSGAGGNIGVCAGPDGVLLVDSGLSTARPQVAQALSTIGAGPIRHLVNTHWHFDHTDGNAWLHEQGAVIVAQENCRKRLVSRTRVEAWKHTFDPSPRGALPVIEFQGSMTLRVNNATIGLDALAPAHTDTDLWVDFKEADVVHLGDIWWNGHYPFIDYSTGGSIDGTIRAVEVALARVTGNTLIIPGHGPVGRREQLAGFRDMLATVRQRVAAMKARGMSLAEVIAAKPTEDFDGQYGHFLMAGSDMCGLAYEGV